MGDMTVSINMGGATGLGSTGGPTQTELKDFQNDIKGQSPENLGNMMADGNLKPWQKQEVMKEFMNQLMEMLKGDETSPDEKKKLEQLLKDLKNSGAGSGNGAGGAKEEELLAKMLEALGIPPDVAQAIAKAMAGNDKKEEPTNGNNV
jgi:hypothetical protein